MARNGYHLSLSLSRELWSDLLHAALPVTLAEGEFDLVGQAREGLRQLGVRERVAGLLEDRRPPELIVRAGDRARRAWRSRKPAIYKRLADVLRVEGTFRVELDDVGSQFRYAEQAVGADAFVKAVVEGTIYFLRENVEIPFTLEKRVGASVTLGDIRFDRGQQAIIGSLQDLALHLGDGAVLELVGRLGEYLLEQQLPKVNPVPPAWVETGGRPDIGDSGRDEGIRPVAEVVDAVLDEAAQMLIAADVEGKALADRPQRPVTPGLGPTRSSPSTPRWSSGDAWPRLGVAHGRHHAVVVRHRPAASSRLLKRVCESITFIHVPPLQSRVHWSRKASWRSPRSAASVTTVGSSRPVRPAVPDIGLRHHLARRRLPHPVRHDGEAEAGVGQVGVIDQ